MKKLPAAIPREDPWSPTFGLCVPTVYVEGLNTRVSILCNNKKDNKLYIFIHSRLVPKNYYQSKVELSMYPQLKKKV